MTGQWVAFLWEVHMTKLSLLLAGLVVGVGGMFFMDPSRGRKRRAQVRRGIEDATRTTRRVTSRTWRTLRDGSSDLAHAVNGKLRAAQAVITH
jgi:hypothetical protein